MVDRLHALMIGVEPDLTLLFDLDPAVGLARATARAGPELRFEDMGLGFQMKARAGFLALAARQDRFRVIDAGQPVAAAACIRRRSSWKPCSAAPRSTSPRISAAPPRRPSCARCSRT